MGRAEGVRVFCRAMRTLARCSGTVLACDARVGVGCAAQFHAIPDNSLQFPGQRIHTVGIYTIPRPVLYILSGEALGHGRRKCTLCGNGVGTYVHIRAGDIYPPLGGRREIGGVMSGGRACVSVCDGHGYLVHMYSYWRSVGCHRARCTP